VQRNAGADSPRTPDFVALDPGCARYIRPGKAGMIVVPRHRVVSIGVARSIAKLAGWI